MDYLIIRKAKKKGSKWGTYPVIPQWSKKEALEYVDKLNWMDACYIYAVQGVEIGPLMY